tara:strand:+ start:8893 stop:10821 length:1929 start_codon:yes stop_codon:yes gene_type:complete
MKDSNKKSIKSSSDSENPEKSIVPLMPKDKRTKAYKEWFEKYGGKATELDKIPEMPKDKRTKAYKQWFKEYGDKVSIKESSTKKTSSEKKEVKSKKESLSDLVISFQQETASDKWYQRRKDIEVLRSKINLLIDKESKNNDKEIKSIFLDSIKIFSAKKRKYFNELNSNQKENLIKRQELIQKIKDLIVVDENPNKLYSKFKILKEQWHETGQVPITDRNNIWETYRHHVSNFYDFLHLNRDLRELDFKHNYEEKIKIIQRAEDLDKIDDIVKASRDLNDLHRLWKNELGPVSREHSDKLWTRFQAASHKIHVKRQSLFKELSTTQQSNYEKKQEVISKMKNLITSAVKTHSEWQGKIKEFENFKIEFQNIKNLNRNKNKKCWDDFRKVARDFNKEKNTFYKNQKKELRKVIEEKKSIINEVKNIIVENKISENLSKVKKLQEDWKKVGYLPRKVSNALWDEFKDELNKFYEILKSGSTNLNEDEQKIFNEKSDFIDKLKFSKKNIEINEVEIESKEIIATWNNMGELNQNSLNILNRKMLKKLSSIINKLDIDDIKKHNLIFDLEIELNRKNSGEVIKKIQFIKRKISEFKNESIQLQNNLEFFSDSSSDNPLFKNVTTKIETIKDDIELWTERLKKVEKA